MLSRDPPSTTTSLSSCCLHIIFPLLPYFSFIRDDDTENILHSEIELSVLDVSNSASCSGLKCTLVTLPLTPPPLAYQCVWACTVFSTSIPRLDTCHSVTTPSRPPVHRMLGRFGLNSMHCTASACACSAQHSTELSEMLITRTARPCATASSCVCSGSHAAAWHGSLKL